MHAWESIQKTLDYIEKNSSETLRIEDLATIAHLSPFYYQRLFKRLTGVSVNEYINKRRLAQAASYLSNHQDKIVDVAFRFGYENHETFTRNFKETFGMTPETYRKNPVILNLFVKPDLFLNYAMVEENVPLISDGIIIEIMRKKVVQPRYFIGIETEIPIEELMDSKHSGVATGAKLWDDFHDRKSSIKNLKEKGSEIGVLYMGQARVGCCMYLAAAEGIDDTHQQGFKQFTLPDAEYLACGFEAESFSELYSSTLYKADQFMERWLEKHQLVSSAEFALEMYTQKGEDIPYLEHWILPKERS